MSTSAIFPFLFCLLLLFLRSPCATADDRVYEVCGKTGNYTANSTYLSNLNLVLSNLTSNGSRTGFATAVFGQIPDRVYGLVLCRGDTNTSGCSSCLSNAAQDILQLCPYDRDATVWYDPCLLRYSNQNFLSSATNSPSMLLYNTQNVTDAGQFDKLLSELLDEISDWAADNSTKRFATGEANFTQPFPTIYGLVQCAPDLSGTDCRRCLQASTDQVQQEIIGSQGGTALGVMCYLRYEVYPFFNGLPTLTLASPPPPAPPQLRPPNPPAGGEKLRLLEAPPSTTSYGI